MAQEVTRRPSEDRTVIVIGTPPSRCRGGLDACLIVEVAEPAGLLHTSGADASCQFAPTHPGPSRYASSPLPWHKCQTFALFLTGPITASPQQPSAQSPRGR